MFSEISERVYSAAYTQIVTLAFILRIDRYFIF